MVCDLDDQEVWEQWVDQYQLYPIIIHIIIMQSSVLPRCITTSTWHLSLSLIARLQSAHLIKHFLLSSTRHMPPNILKKGAHCLQTDLIFSWGDWEHDCCCWPCYLKQIGQRCWICCNNMQINLCCDDDAMLTSEIIISTR